MGLGSGLGLPVPVVRDAAAVVDVPVDVLERRPWDHLLLVEEHAQRLNGHLEVGGVEVVPDVPAERAELAPLLHGGVEEGGTKD